MKYILLLFITFPIFTQSINNSKPTPADTIDNSKITTEIGRDFSQSNQNEESKDNTNLTQAEIRKKRKWEIGLGYGAGNLNFSQTPRIMNLSLEYNLTSRFSVGYAHLHAKKYSTSPRIGFNGAWNMGEETNLLEVGLLNFRYYFFEKFPLYITGGLGRDFVSHYKRVDYQYGWYENGYTQNSPVIRETNSPPANYQFLGLGFQWIFQNGFFIGVEVLRLRTQYTYKGSFLILDKNYTVDGIIFEKILNSTYKEDLDFQFRTFRLGYSFQF